MIRTLNAILQALRHQLPRRGLEAGAAVSGSLATHDGIKPLTLNTTPLTLKGLIF